MIAFNAEATLGKCLDSIRPFVAFIAVGVDQRTSDKTAKVARKHGADLVFPVQVSDYHECPQHGRVLAQHFARARNDVFARLPADKVDWLLWVDSDDTLVGGEKLLDMLSKVPEQVNCVWLPYLYSTVNDGAGVTTSFDRERLLRTTVKWEWSHRVHETVAPVGTPVVPMRASGIHVWHQEGVHKTENSALRNHLLLEIELEENPNDTRSIFYMANGLFAQQRFAECVDWYARTGENRACNPYERWQAYVYLSLAYERLGDLDAATQAAWLAIDILPQFKEPYYRLATLSLLASEFEKCVYWTQEADRRQEPPYFVFKNPMEYSFNSRAALADAYYHMGQVPRALEAARAAYAVSQTPTLKEMMEHCQALIDGAEQANGFVALSKGLDDSEIERLYYRLPLAVRSFGRCRDVAVPAILRQRRQRVEATADGEGALALAAG